MNALEGFLSPIFAISISLVLGWLFVFRTEKVVRFHARLTRSVQKDLFQIPDEKLDEEIRLPIDNYVLGTRSVYVKEGAEHPENFPRFMAAIRLLGCFFLLGGIFVTLIVVFVLLTGAGHPPP